MKQFPVIPAFPDAPSGLLDGGHLWLQEDVDGGPLRFQLRESGRVRFGDRDGVFDDDVPLPYRSAVRHVRERFDRGALRDAVDDVASLAFFGVATFRRDVDYDWSRIPAVLGVDVWSADRGGFLPPDAVEQAFERLGLTPVNAFEKEVRATDFDPERYEVPDSNWYDGPAAGVVVRNKTGARARIANPSVREGEGPRPVEAPPGELAARFATDDRLDEIASELEARGRPVSVDAVFDRALESVVRAEYARLFHPDASVDPTAFRSALGERVRRFLSDRD